MTIGVPRHIAAIFVVVALLRGVSAIAADAVHWATGAALEQRLAGNVSLQFANSPMRQAIRRISEAKQVAILLDRRVDPGQKLDITLKDVSLESALQAIARRSGLGMSRLGNVVYFGPAPVAKRLRAVAAALEKDVRRLPSAAQRKYLSPKRLAWDDLASPRDLLTELARQNGLKIDGLEKMPHDLWASADLPAISLIDRLTLIAIQFDLTFKPADGGRRLDLVAVTAE